ncbi:MAG: beta-lactamase family protein [candidate division Zixibacteria bacterium]|nr:beta-lactamase family protein [candidate division Zixibacteria bacterium]
MIQMNAFLVYFLIVAGLVSPSYAQQVDTSLVDVDQKIGLWMKEWNVPGMAVGVVKDGQMLLFKGYGVRDAEKGLPVIPNTVFCIASNTKAFTSVSAALLVDAGKLEWDKPVVDVVPEFKVADSFVNREITIRDMLCHRSGLPEHFLLYDIFPTDRERLVKSLQYTQPTLGFRQVYHYNNVVYAVAGYIVGRIAGMTWEDFVQENIFNPLGMDHSSFGLDIQQAEEFAYPYEYKDGLVRVNTFRDEGSANPAGGINSSLDDMLKWLDLYQNFGKVGEKRIVSKENLDQTYTAQIINKYLPWSSTSPMGAYGLGWHSEVYRGHLSINHGGILFGRYASWIVWLPKDEVGIVILSNAGTMLPYYLSYIITEKLIGIDIAYWDSILAKEAEDERKASENEPVRSVAIPPSLAEKLRGMYFNPAYGNAEVRITDTMSAICFGEQVQLPLSYLNDSTLEALNQEVNFPFEISLTRDQEDQVISFKGAFCPWQDVEFRRISD